MTKRLAIFGSGRGSNGEAIYQAIQEGRVHGIIVVVITDYSDAPIIDRAKRWGVPVHIVERKVYDSKNCFEQAMLDILAPYAVDGILLAGYMRLLGHTFISAYEHKILNIHPALLPSFPGLHAQRQAIMAGVKISGCTIHFVDEGMDSGPIIMQAVVPVYADDTEDSLCERLLPVEHATYCKAVALFCDNRLTIYDGIVRIEEEP